MKNDIKQSIDSGSPEAALKVAGQQIALLRIPAGTFLMGSPPTEKGHRSAEAPVRRIALTKPFYMGKLQITQEQYQAVMGENPSSFRGEALAVDQITYAKAREFCSRLSDIVRVAVTLPTEAQWEYACRAGTTTPYYSGTTEAELAKVAWFRNNAKGTVQTVGQKEPNAFGLYDMLGNVCEICLDSLSNYEGIPTQDPVGYIQVNEGAMRGGAWMHSAEFCRAAFSMITSDMFGGAGIRITVNL